MHRLAATHRLPMPNDAHRSPRRDVTSTSRRSCGSSSRRHARAALRSGAGREPGARRSARAGTAHGAPLDTHAIIVGPDAAAGAQRCLSCTAPLRKRRRRMVAAARRARLIVSHGRPLSLAAARPAPAAATIAETAMTPVVLQIALPDRLELSEGELAKITGRTTVAKQVHWLDENGWTYVLSADRGVIVGTLYAHLRLAGLHPVDVANPASVWPAGFNFAAIR